MKIRHILKTLFLSTILTSFISCNNTKSIDCSNNPDFVKKEYNLSKSNEINGVFIFIKNNPICKYSVLGICKNDVLDQVGSATKGKKFGQAIKGLFDVSNQNMDFQKLLDNMVEKAKKEHSDVEGLIFKENLSSCEVIKFE